MVTPTRTLIALLGFALAASAQRYYTYVGNLSSDSVLLAWGTTDGDNTIGRSSPSHGEATINMAGRRFTSRQNWAIIGGLRPDTVYPYEVSLEGRQITKSAIQTWAERDNKLVFFVIGDYGNASRTQYAVARAMSEEYQRRNAAGNPVRFVLTTGDNIYGDLSNFILGLKNTGARDSDWQRKFFEPYEDLLAHIPFYPSLGNHDGNETENRADLQAYLDNFFFPGDKPARWYTFSYGGLADFFALDSTMNTESGPTSPQYVQSRPEWIWMQQALSESKAPWKIPYFHHPPFNAGPRHAAAYRDIEHWLNLFGKCGVRVAFQGHEHNFQVSHANEASRGIRFVTSGAGGELRSGNIQSKMAKANIALWSPQNHFLVVEIEGKTMSITPVGFENITVVDANGKNVAMPLTITLP